MALSDDVRDLRVKLGEVAEDVAHIRGVVSNGLVDRVKTLESSQRALLWKVVGLIAGASALSGLGFRLAF
jgi:hypothetical protein